MRAVATAVVAAIIIGTLYFGREVFVPIALAGTIGYIWAGHGLPQMPPGSIGYLYLPGLAVISIASMLMAPVGARTAHRMDIQPLRKLFAIVLYCLAAYFLLR